MLLQAGLCRGVVHQGVDGRADLPVGAVGPDDQLEDRPLPPAVRRHRRGDPGRLEGLVPPPRKEERVEEREREKETDLFFVLFLC